FIYAALLLATAYLTKGRGFMSLFESRAPKPTLKRSNRRVTSVVRGLVELDTQLGELEGLVAKQSDSRSREETND
ncbi:MAG TPA: hypothetical protein DCX77_02395, partial [Acidimicrobiaceae bacterium]|nr:hypothetical protein [Acidimicrobiaceae bacterium]